MEDEYKETFEENEAIFFKKDPRIGEYFVLQIMEQNSKIKIYVSMEPTFLDAKNKKISFIKCTKKIIIEKFENNATYITLLLHYAKHMITYANQNFTILQTFYKQSLLQESVELKVATLKVTKGMGSPKNINTI